MIAPVLVQVVVAVVLAVVVMLVVEPVVALVVAMLVAVVEVLRCQRPVVLHVVSQVIVELFRRWLAVGFSECLPHQSLVDESNQVQVLLP